MGGCDTAIESGLEETQANEVIVALDSQGISAVKAREEGTSDVAHYRVEVAQGDVGRSLAVLRAAELPHHPQPGLADVFGEGGLVPTATEERAKYTAALAGELARSIESIDGVLAARVHVALPETRDAPLDGPPARPRASVMIKYQGARAPYDDGQIRALVAGAVDGMEAGDVAIVGVAAPRVPIAAGSTLVRVGPIAVTRGSSMALRAIGGVLLGVIASLAVSLVVAVRRRRPSAVVDAAAPPAA